MKQSWKPGTLIYPLPAVLVSVGATPEEYNMLTVAWTGTVNSEPPMCYISVRPERHSYPIIERTGEFVINLTTEDMARATDWCGVRSGRDFDKWKECRLPRVAADYEEEPVIAEAPLSIECRVRQIVKLGSHDMFIADVVGILADERYIDPATGRFSLEAAKPLVGLFSDWLIAQGGTTVLTEVPGMFGAETILMDRAESRQVFDRTVCLINDFKGYFRKFDQPIYENPSPGNKKGGITTLEEKSLGCVQKGGAQQVVDVLKYTQPICRQGLNLLQAPGNDLVAASALALSGCQLVLFTTGRGTPFGAFVPTMKISTNTQLSKFKSNWIDFNAGTLVEDEEPQAVLERFIAKVLATANGEHLLHEKTGFKEIAIFKTGVTL